MLWMGLRSSQDSSGVVVGLRGCERGVVIFPRTTLGAFRVDCIDSACMGSKCSLR